MRWGQKKLTGVCHVVRLVEKNHLVSAAKNCARASEVFDLLFHHVDSTIVRGIQLERHALVLWPKNLLGEGEGRRRLAGAGRPIEQKMWQSIVGHKPAHWWATREQV